MQQQSDPGLPTALFPRTAGEGLGPESFTREPTGHGWAGHGRTQLWPEGALPLWCAVCRGLRVPLSGGSPQPPPFLSHLSLPFGMLWGGGGSRVTAGPLKPPLRSLRTPTARGGGQTPSCVLWLRFGGTGRREVPSIPWIWTLGLDVGDPRAASLTRTARLSGRTEQPGEKNTNTVLVTRTLTSQGVCRCWDLTV